MIFLLLGLLAPNAFSAAPAACTEMGCTSGLQVSLPDRKWTEGKYVFKVLLDGKAIRCEGALPLRPCGEPSIRCDGEGVLVEESGCALPTPHHGWGNIRVSSEPAKVEIEVLRNGKKIAGARAQPIYRILQPNGPHCEPTCRQASIELTFR